MTDFGIPVLGFSAYSGTGKTTLLRKLIPLLRAEGVRVAVIKHAHHDFDIDTPGKDSYELRKAGADQVLIASDKRRALITETRPAREPELAELVKSFDLTQVDLVMVEGFRHLQFNKIELHRLSLAKPLIFPEDSSIIAIASDKPVDAGDLVQLDINSPGQISIFITGWLKNQS
jgi:molybdopterin-guanine dinucleotide biosynthesis protein MobB